MRIPPSMRYRVAGLLILIVGAVCALVVYLTQPPSSDDPLSYTLVDGVAYPVAPGDAKAYRHDLERFGGKAAVYADEFNRWFERLWSGRTLSGTILVLSVVAAAACFHAGRGRKDGDR